MDTKESPNTKGNLLIVDDEETYLKIQERIFSKHYTVQTAISGEKALEILEHGFAASVIMSDQKMPGMTGAEFLEKSMAYSPNATRIIVTGFSSPKDIIPCINQGHAYMFLTKPVEELELIQAVKVAFDYYQSTVKSKKLFVELNQKVKTLNDRNLKLTHLLKESQEQFSQAVQVITGILNDNERFYYTSHAKNVAVIAKTIAEEIEFEKASIPIIVLSSLLHTATNAGMPKKFLIMDPFELEEEERVNYFEKFAKGIENLSKLKLLQKHTKIISQIWERHDGSGYPNGLASDDIFKEAQIIALANMYHNAVYRIKPEQISELLEKGSLEQAPEVTKQRHDECIKFLYKKASWFDIDIFNAFHDAVKKKNCKSLVPTDSIVTAYCIDSDPKRVVVLEKAADEEKIEEAAKIEQEEAGKRIKMIDKEIPLEDLEPGMTVSHNIAAKTGHLIVKQETVLTDTLVKQINQYFNNDMLKSDKIYIMVPKKQ